MLPLGEQLTWLFVLAAPVACVAWTMTHEEVFAELKTYCDQRVSCARSVWVRKFFYLFTCEYCFSHYVAAAAVGMVNFRLLLPDWRGFVIAWFTVVWVANAYMGLFGRLRLDIKRERVEIKAEEKVIEKLEESKPGQPLVRGAVRDLAKLVKP